MTEKRDDESARRQYALAVFWEAALGFWRRGSGSNATARAKRPVLSA